MYKAKSSGRRSIETANSILENSSTLIRRHCPSTTIQLVYLYIPASFVLPCPIQYYLFSTLSSHHQRQRFGVFQSQLAPEQISQAEQRKQYDFVMLASACTNFNAEQQGPKMAMQRNGHIKSPDQITYLLKEMGSIHNKKPHAQQRVATAADPMADELRQMSRDGKSDNTALPKSSGCWTAIDRSRQAGADRPWDGVAYVHTRRSDRQEAREHQQTRDSCSQSSSVYTERGSDS